MPPSTDRARVRRRDAKLCGVALLAMGAFAVLHLVAPEVSWFRRLEVLTFDVRLRLRGPRLPGPETILVMIDDESAAALGHWPVPRRAFADALDFLRGAEARVVAFDVLFADAESDGGGESGDALFAQAIRKAGNVVLPFAFRFERGAASNPPGYVARAAFAAVKKGSTYVPTALHPTGVLAPIALLGEAAAATGHVTIAFDVDGAPRYDYPAVDYDVDYYPSVALRILQLYQGVPWPDVAVELGAGVRLGDVVVATDPSMRLLVDYLGPQGTFPTVPFSTVVGGAAPASLFRDRIVIIGTDVTGIQDTVRTPFDAVLPGSERLATIVDGMLHGRDLRRPVFAAWLEAAWMIGFALLAGLAISRLSIVAATVLAASLLAAYLAAGQVALQNYGMWLAAAMPMAASILTFTLLLIYRYGSLDREHRRIRQAFQRYLAPHMVEKLAESRSPPELGGEVREITVLFCDLRGFSAISEKLDARDLTRLINEFFTVVTEAVLAHGGTVDKYMGDAVMAFWNAPIEQPDHVVLACRAALDIVKGLDRLNAQPDRPAALVCGIGINTGACTVGNFGSRHRFDYSALGDAVNIAARIEGETKNFGVRIALGPTTAARLPDFATLPLDLVKVRGREHEIELWALIGDETRARDRGFLALRVKHLAFRQAMHTERRDVVRARLEELAAAAPPDLASLYQALGDRLAA
ncbi:MAG TPA: adenylate/guanylate cyclase domain-containing protein [Stellaceae bacterium]|nr:adenylate/guanylate cyclase domain-containing protein [Stellaceae bacterium]